MVKERGCKLLSMSDQAKGIILGRVLSSKDKVIIIDPETEYKEFNEIISQTEEGKEK